MRRAAVAATAIGLTIPVVLAAPAHADGELSLSRDGIHWHDRLVRPLFDPAIRWVPGDVRSSRFYVRNASPQAGAISMDVEHRRRAALLDSSYLFTMARADGGSWHRLPADGLSRLIDDEAISSGRTIPVDIRVTMGHSAPNGTMVLASDLDFLVTIQDARAVFGSGEPAAAPAGGTSGGLLPNTGSPVEAWVPGLGLGALVLGRWVARAASPTRARPCLTRS